MVSLTFMAGTLELRGVPEQASLSEIGCMWDERAHCYRAPAQHYAEILRALHKLNLQYQDEARAYVELTDGLRARRTPRYYQEEALDAWLKQRAQGVVVLPTGAGKTWLGMMAIDAKRRSALVVTPTLDLVRQWYDTLRATFATRVGIVGGGSYEVLPITVTTYDSAYLHMENLGALFGLIIFDECHHLPSETYSLAAQCSLAPFRLGLTATPERTDGRDVDLAKLLGPIVYRRDIVELSGNYLADYETERVVLELSKIEWDEYHRERQVYLDFVRSQGIQFGSPQGWSDFIMRSSRSAQGKRAMQAYRRQRQIAFATPVKLDYVEHLLHLHRQDRALLFTDDNATAYTISRRFLIPAITHQTKVHERSEILEKFSKGEYNAIVTSKVLNEGVDVPEARVAIVISGSGSVREHVQRLGRVLRKKEGKRAVLYELISGGTSERYTSERRREHIAYR